MPFNRFSRFRSPRRRGFMDQGRRMRAVDWSAYSLTKFEKKFYRECSKVRDRSRRDIEEFRSRNKVTVLGHNVPRPLFKFSEAGFSSDIMSVIKKNNWDKPTPIQCQSWPVILSGRDLVGIAQSGSGKIATYLLPGIVHSNAQPAIKRGEGPIVLVLVPTKELTQQVEKTVNDFCSKLGIRSACVYGGGSRTEQLEQLNKSPEIVIATPSRLLDFLDSRGTNLRRCTYLVLDEADRMLDMGFEHSLRKIASQVRPDRQTLLWSATWRREVKALAEDFLYDYIQINFGSTKLDVTAKVRQVVEVVGENEKFRRLVSLLKTLDRSRALIFTETENRTDNLCDQLREKGFNAAALHGDKHKDRDKALEQFRTGRVTLLVATDIASRGVDIDDVRYVINYDYPGQIEDYIQRIGRTGKNDKKGTAYTFFTMRQSRLASELIDLLKEAKQDVPDELLRFTNGHSDDRVRLTQSWRREKSGSSRSRSPLKETPRKRRRSLSSNDNRSLSSSRTGSRERSKSGSGERYRARSKSHSQNDDSAVADRSRSVSFKQRKSSFKSESRSPSNKVHSRSTTPHSRQSSYRETKASRHSSSDTSVKGHKDLRDRSVSDPRRRTRTQSFSKPDKSRRRSRSSSDKSIQSHSSSRSRSRNSSIRDISSPHQSYNRSRDSLSHSPNEHLSSSHGRSPSIHRSITPDESPRTEPINLDDAIDVSTSDDPQKPHYSSKEVSPEKSPEPVRHSKNPVEKKELSSKKSKRSHDNSKSEHRSSISDSGDRGTTDRPKSKAGCEKVSRRSYIHKRHSHSGDSERDGKSKKSRSSRSPTPKRKRHRSRSRSKHSRSPKKHRTGQRR